mmetsp:Transcript_47203/g.102748  ORF Transcript_47203/g.102748 Transcript_47203/m.102748 type:complete len:229 (+) Transcript_47203:856-1542(+)
MLQLLNFASQTSHFLVAQRNRLAQLERQCLSCGLRRCRNAVSIQLAAQCLAYCSFRRLKSRQLFCAIPGALLTTFNLTLQVSLQGLDQNLQASNFAEPLLFALALHLNLLLGDVHCHLALNLNLDLLTVTPLLQLSNPLLQLATHAQACAEPLLQKCLALSAGLFGIRTRTGRVISLGAFLALKFCNLTLTLFETYGQVSPLSFSSRGVAVAVFRSPDLLTGCMQLAF